MVHIFSYSKDSKSYYFLWDIEGGSLHVVDYSAYLVAKDYYNKLDTNELDDFKKLDFETIQEIREELISLEKSGLLNIPYNEPKITSKRKDVKALCLHICHDCNLRCLYCFGDEGTYSTERDYMSLDVGCKAIDFLIKSSGDRKFLEVDFFGGEPLMNFDVVKGIVDYADDKCKKAGKTISYTITTNGVLLSKEISKYLAEKMQNVVISIDGMKETHNRVRKTVNGKDCYDTIVKNAQYFRKLRGDKEYYIRGTFTGLDVEFVKGVLHLRDQGFDQISMEPVVLAESHPIAIKKEQLPIIYEQYEKLSREYIDSRKVKEKWFNFYHFMIDLENGPCITKRLTGCGAGCEYLAISPKGDIYPCHQFVGKKDFLMGSVFNDNFEFNRDIQDKFSKITVTYKEDCKDCMAKYYCSGGCIANSYNYEGSINKPYKAGCEMMRKRLELSLAIYAIEKFNLD